MKKKAEKKTRKKQFNSLGLGRVHLVERHDHLLHAERVRQQRVLARLPVLGDAGLEATGRRVDDQHGAVGLRGSGDHVLDEVAVAGRVDDGAVVLGGLELPEGDVDGDTALALGLELFFFFFLGFVLGFGKERKKCEFFFLLFSSLRFLFLSLFLLPPRARSSPASEQSRT